MYSKTYQKSLNWVLFAWNDLKWVSSVLKRFDLYVVIEFMSRVNRMLHPNNFSKWFQFVIYSFAHERSRTITNDHESRVCSGQIRQIRTGSTRTSFGIDSIDPKQVFWELKFVIKVRRVCSSNWLISDLSP